MTTELNRENLEAFLLTRGNIDPEIFLPGRSSAILYVDAALQLKKKGYNHVIGIKNGGIPYAKVLQLAGYDSSEIEYHKEEEGEPIINQSETEILRSKKVILIDEDLDTGKTFREVVKFLYKRGIKVGGIFIDFWNDVGFWSTEAGGLRKLRKTFSKERKTPRGLDVFTSTNARWINEATDRVLRYFSSATNI